MNDFLSLLSFRGYQASIEHADHADWITVVAYSIAALVSGRAARIAAIRGLRRERAFWIGMAALMMFFGVNEILDLQTILTAIGKAMAQAGGWYEQRRYFQAAFIAVLAAGTLVAGLALMRLVRAAHWAVRLAVFGLVFIAAFVLVRAASMHHVDAALDTGWSRFALHWDPEMIGIVLVIIAAHAYARRNSGRRHRSRGA